MREFVFLIKVMAICIIQPFTSTYAQSEGMVSYIYFQDLGVPGYVNAALYFNNKESAFYVEKFKYSSDNLVVKPGERLVLETEINKENTAQLNFRCHLSSKNNKLSCIENLIVSKPVYVEEKIPSIKWVIQDSIKTFSSLTAKKKQLGTSEGVLIMSGLLKIYLCLMDHGN